MPIRKRITLADVADSAGVATMAGSRYLNAHPNVTQRTAREVQAAAQHIYSQSLQFTCKYEILGW